MVEIPDLRPQHGNHLQQLLIGPLDHRRVEIEHADYLVLEQDGKQEGIVPARLCAEVLAQQALLVPKIVDPQRFARLPDRTDEPDTRGESERAGVLVDSLDRAARNAPSGLKAHEVPAAVDAPVLPGLPAFGLANCANRVL